VQTTGARVVTPEAVVLDVQTAGLGSRVFARAIDGLIQAAGLFLVLVASGVAAASSNSGFGTAGWVVDLILVTLILFGYPIAFESLWRGRTPGKAALGIRVVTRQGAPIRFRHALVRGLLGMVEVLALPLVAVISMLISPRDQRLGDLAAGTIVIRERAAGAASVPVAFFPPRGWESFVAGLDVSGVTAAEYETIRSFLIRAPQMARLPRANLAVRLAGPLVGRLQQPVPAGADPELWLACVASAYQRRHGGPAMPGPPPAWGPPPPAWRPPAGPPPPQGPPAWGPRTAPPAPAPPPAWGPPAAPPAAAPPPAWGPPPVPTAAPAPPAPARPPAPADQPFTPPA
jgi:uncharacterized RDD family membrane protein YckC